MDDISGWWEIYADATDVFTLMYSLCYQNKVDSTQGRLGLRRKGQRRIQVAVVKVWLLAAERRTLHEIAFKGAVVGWNNGPCAPRVITGTLYVHGLSGTCEVGERIELPF